MKNYVKNKDFQLGVCYYPEHWSEELWSDDFKRMVDLGFSTIRIGEFAWSLFEPNEGEFSFDLFDRALDSAHEHGLKVVMGTPTATPPAWLTHKYPEVLNVSSEGKQYQHGQRRHYNYNTDIYRNLSARIVRKMADHYKNHPAVIGWQIDNELNCETDVFYSEADNEAFRKWAKEKYETLDKLNDTWGTVFWSQTYTDWEQIYLTRPTVSDSPNPHQALDEKRFFSDSAISFAALQANIIKEVAPDHWITTNGLFGHLDNHHMTNEILDFFAYDSYPNFSTIYPDQGDNPLLDRKWSWNLSNVRSIGSSFAVFEQQSGGGGWVNRMVQPSPKSGQMRLWTYQSIAHGADMLLYFRWRTATMGTEMYWHGINDYHNQPNRRVEEAGRIGKELKEVGNTIKGSVYQADVAILRDYDNDWDGEMDLWHGPLSSKSNISWFKALQYNHIPADVFYVHDDTTSKELERFKTLIYPHPTIMTERTAELLTQFTENGGTVIFGCRAGYKDKTGQCYMKPFPGLLQKLTGVTVEEFSMISESQEPPQIETETGSMEASGFFEVLKSVSADARVLATYDDRYNKGKPALVKNTFGKGQVYYYGGVFTEQSANFILSDLEIRAPHKDWLHLPKMVELSIRRGEDGKEYIFLLNYSDKEQIVTADRKTNNILKNIAVEGSFKMEPFGVAILTMK